MKYTQIEYLNIEPDNTYEELINTVITKCFDVEGLKDKNLYVSIILTTPQDIQIYNKEYRKIDKATDVLSFPMFEKEEIQKIQQEGNEIHDVLGDIIISLAQVKVQAEEYGHSFERELAYMLVHGFYHLMGYDHMTEEDKVQMRPKEEYILTELKINRE